MPFFRSATGNTYSHPFQGNKTISADPVQLEHDSWVDAQLEAGLIVEVVEDKPTKIGKKEQAE